MNLEDLESKESLIREFYTWLLDDDRILNKDVIFEKEIDFSLVPYYNDANIYYPKQIAAFFDTKAMKRLGRISQLDLAIDEYPNVYHNRLEHSKGVYYRKLEEMLSNFQNPCWKKNIENNKLKLHLLAELIKMAGHDIGHPPLSHGLEIIMFSHRGIHEEIGQRIMLEDSEIQAALKNISPDLPDILSELYNKSILNFNEHDDSNNDVDRLDYLVRDSLYTGNPIHLPHSNYETVSVELDNNGHHLTNTDGSIIISNNSTSTIDIYDYSALSDIENFLETRENGYKNIYFLPQTTIKEKTILAFFEAFLESDSQSGMALKNYINEMKSANISTFDLSLFEDWDDIKFYSQIIDVIKNHENSEVRDLAIMTLPNMTSFLNMIYSHLEMYAKNRNYSEEDKHFLCEVKSLIHSKRISRS